MTEEGSFQFIPCARWRSKYYVILRLQFPKDKPCVVSISKPFSAMMNAPPALVCMQITGLVKLMKGPALPDWGHGAAQCLPADSKSILPLALAALGWFCVYKQGPFPGKHCNMSNRWRALFAKDDRSNPIVWAILKETDHIATSSRHQSRVRRRMEWSAQPVQAWHPHSPCDSNLCFLASPWKAPARSSLWDSMLRRPASSLSLHSDTDSHCSRSCPRHLSTFVTSFTKQLVGLSPFFPSCSTAPLPLGLSLGLAPTASRTWLTTFPAGHLSWKHHFSSQTNWHSTQGRPHPPSASLEGAREAEGCLFFLNPFLYLHNTHRTYSGSRVQAHPTAFSLQPS